MIRKLVVVGDGACGKTCLLSSYSTNEFPSEYIPTIFDTYSKDITLDGQELTLALWDTAGEEDYDRLRPLSYQRSNVILICFGIDSPVSFQNTRHKWFPEIDHFLPDVPFILVGNKVDLRSNEHTLKALKKVRSRPVTYSQGEKMANKLGAHKYMECSAKFLMGVKDIFEEAIRISFTRRKNAYWRKCIYL